MIDRDSFQVSLTMKINLISEDAGSEEEGGQMGSVNYQFGVNKVPTKAEMDAAIKESIDMFNKQLNVTDTRLVTMEDFGFASPRNLIWQFDEDAPATQD